MEIHDDVPGNRPEIGAPDLRHTWMRISVSSFVTIAFLLAGQDSDFVGALKYLEVVSTRCR